MIELTITVKDENSKLVEKDLIEGPLELSQTSDFLFERIRAAVIKFGPSDDSSPDITVKCLMDFSYFGDSQYSRLE
jgi:hypothetical protein